MPAQYPRGNRPNRVFGVGGRTRGADAEPIDVSVKSFRPGVGGSPRGRSFGRSGLILRRKPIVFYTYAGVTRDAAGAPIGACRVELYERSSGTRVGATVSDGSGVFSFPVPNDVPNYFAVAWTAAGLSAATGPLEQGAVSV